MLSAVSVRKAKEEKKGRKDLPVPEGGIEPTTLHNDPLLQLLYEYHEGYIFLYPMHMKERERESVIELNYEGTENYLR